MNNAFAVIATVVIRFADASPGRDGPLPNLAGQNGPIDHSRTRRASTLTDTLKTASNTASQRQWWVDLERPFAVLITITKGIDSTTRSFSYGSIWGGTRRWTSDRYFCEVEARYALQYRQPSRRYSHEHHAE